jgi:outer membrane receptor protein involved in Fe transport
VTDESKGTSVTVKSNESGGYTVEHMIPDLYTVKVEATGFKSFETTHLQVLADTSPKVDAAMQTGGASETVNVNADAIPQLKTDRADVALTLDQKTVADLPVSGRNFTSLQLLLPGAQQLGWGHAADENPQGSQQIQIDGQAFGGTAFELDGTDNQDPILGIIVVNPALDAVTESKIATQNFDAEFGKAVSAVVTAQTKSGTNNFHGSAYDYRRSNANLARNPFSQNPSPADPHRVGNLIPGGLYNEFGGTIGGPAIKDRLFFFGDYQGQRQRAGISGTQTVPTALLMNTCLGAQIGPGGIPGCDFSEYATQLAGGPNNPLIYDPLTGKQFPNNVIPTARLSPQALALFKLLQPYAPTTAPSGVQGNTGIAGNYSASGAGLFNADQWDVRGDMQVTQKIHAFGRFSRFTDTLTGTTIFGPAGGTGFGLQGYGGASTGANDSFAGGADMAVNPSLLTDFRLGYYRFNIITSKYDQGQPFSANLGIPGLNLDSGFTSGASAFNLTEVGSTGDPNNAQNVGPQYGSGLNVNRFNCPLSQKEDQYQIVNNWTKILGNHAIKFGADLRYARNLRVPSDVNRAGQLNFGTGPTANQGVGGLGFATFLLGDVSTFGRYASTSTNAKEFQKRLFFYVQDTWRFTPNLTLNLGVRYELYYPETVNGKGNGALLNLDTGYLQVAEFGRFGSNMGWDPSYKAISPRIGAAYQLNPKTVIRAGYGRSFDLGVFGSIFGHSSTQNLPILTNQSLSEPSGPTSNTSAFTLASGPPPVPVTVVPASGLLPNPGNSVTSIARPNPLRLPTIDAWNLSLQRSITPTLSVTLAYVGNKGTHTLSAQNGNTLNPNESGIFLPAQFSINGQTLHYTTKAAEGSATPNALGIYPDNGTNNSSLLQRYYAGTLPACQDPNYVPPAIAGLPAGGCGWNTSISDRADSQDTHFNALQISVAKQFTKGLTFNANYAWQRSMNFASGYATWLKQAGKGRDDFQREQQIVAYGSYELPFGKNKAFASNVPTYLDEVIGGWQISPIVTYASGLPFTLTYQECSTAIPGNGAPCYPNGNSKNLKLHIAKLNTANHNRLAFHGATVPLTQQPFLGFTAPALDQIGTAGRNGAFGPNFFNTDIAVQKNFPIHESLFAQFRMDAYNAFNHISLGTPGGSVDNGDQTIGGVFGSQFPTRQLQFSIRLQF